MPLLNYTTTIEESKTIGEITGLLITSRASAILTEFDAGGNATALSFKITGKYGVMSYRLPCEYKAAQQVLNKQAQSGKVPRRYYNDAAQARRVAWRITRQWLEAQLALVELQMVPIEQIFLSYMQTDDGRTIFERLQERKFIGLMLEGPKEQ